MSASREKFLAQLERCVAHQNQSIAPPNELPFARDEYHCSTEFVPEEPMGNGTSVYTDASAIWGLRPPGDETGVEYMGEGGWA